MSGLPTEPEDEILARGELLSSRPERAPSSPPSLRPFSHQAEEGSREAEPGERPPYRVVPPVDTLGTRHIEEALNDLQFPLTRTDLLERAGAWRVPVTGSHYRTLAEYLVNVEQKEFRTPVEVTRAIERAWRRR